MKADIHPPYKKVELQFPQGDKTEINSTYGQDKLILDVDFRAHPAWTKKGVVGGSTSSAKVSSFNKKFGSLDFSVGAKK